MSIDKLHSKNLRLREGSPDLDSKVGRCIGKVEFTFWSLGSWLPWSAGDKEGKKAGLTSVSAKTDATNLRASTARAERRSNGIIAVEIKCSNEEDEGLLGESFYVFIKLFPLGLLP